MRAPAKPIPATVSRNRSGCRIRLRQARSSVRLYSFAAAGTTTFLHCLGHQRRARRHPDPGLDDRSGPDHSCGCRSSLANRPSRRARSQTPAGRLPRAPNRGQCRCRNRRRSLSVAQLHTRRQHREMSYQGVPPQNNAIHQNMAAAQPCWFPALPGSKHTLPPPVRAAAGRVSTYPDKP